MLFRDMEKLFGKAGGFSENMGTVSERCLGEPEVLREPEAL